MTTSPMAVPAKASISQHRAFPAIVAVWFAALLGFGTMVMPAILLERVVEVTGLASAIPAANPPLGQTAHLLVALVAASLGAALGLVIARQVTRAHSPSSGKPILDVREEIDDEPRFVAPQQFEAAGNGDDPDQNDPEDAGDEWLDLADPRFADEPTVEAEAEAPLEQFPTFAELERRRAQRRSSGEASVPVQIERRLFLRRSEDEPLAFAAPSLAHRLPDNENSPAAETVQADGEEALAQFMKPAEAASAGAAMPTWQSEPLEQLGLVQLVERLGSSLARRRAMAPPVPKAAPAAATGLEMAAPEEAARAMADYFAAPQISLNHEGTEDTAAIEGEDDFGSLLSLRPAAPSTPEPDQALRQALATLQRMSRSA